MGSGGRGVSRQRSQMMGNRDFLKRIEKSLYYGKLPSIPCVSLPVMELSADMFSEAQKGKSLKRLYIDNAAELTRNACVSPCSLVLALLYLERLKNFNPDYVADIAPADLFLVSLMVSNKFLHDDGEEDEVFVNEWAASAGITPTTLNQLERKFLHAIDWRVFVDEAHFESTLQWLEQQIALRQAKLRGWFTYTDLANINNVVESVGLLRCLVTVYIALSISYIASVYTLAASSFIVTQSLMTLTASNRLVDVFNYANCNNNMAQTVNTSYVHNVVPENFASHPIEETDLAFENSANDDPPKISHMDYFKPLYALFLQKILQATSGECTNMSKGHDPYENQSASFELIQNDLKRHDACIVNIHRLNIWSRPVFC